MNIGFVATRLAGTDGVSLESFKLTQILERMGNQVFYCAGELGKDAPPGTLVPKMHFKHPEIRSTYDQCFQGQHSTRLGNDIDRLSNELEEGINLFVKQYSIDVLVTQNCQTIPMNVPLGVALANFIEQTKIPTIAHHHDFYWERKRFESSSVTDILEQYFPPDLPTIKHLVINSLAKESMRKRKRITASVIPNVLDFETTPPSIDDFNRHLRKDLDLATQDTFILQPTRVVPRKGIELAIELVKNLDDPRCKLIITHKAGDEGMRYFHKLRKIAEREGVGLRYVADKFSRKRSQSADGNKTYNLWDAYLHADFVTYPSLIEGFGNALLETIYFHLPALVNRYPVYVADIAPQGFDFVEINQQITRETTRDVRQLLSDSRNRSNTVEHNYLLAQKLYSYETASKVLHDSLTLLFP